VEDPQLHELTEALGDRYDVEEHPDGSFVLRPKLTAAAARARLGGRDATQEEFEAAFGDLPTGRY